MREFGATVAMETFRHYQPPGPDEIAQLIRAERQTAADDQRLAHTLAAAVLATLVVVAIPLRGELGWSFGAIEWAGLVAVAVGLLIMMGNAISDTRAVEIARQRVQNRFSPLLPVELDAVNRIRQLEQGEEAVQLLLAKVSVLRVHEYELLCNQFYERGTKSRSS